MPRLASLKQAIKRCFLPRGMRPHTIRGGLLRGRRMHLDLQVDTQVWRGRYEQSFQDWLCESVCESSVCFDVGAAEGWATLQMAVLAKRGRVFAFEPSERGAWTPKNLELNPDVDPQRVLFQRAFVGADERQGTVGEPPFVSIDKVVARERVERVDLIKIDVDGPELEVLAGAAETLERWRPHLCVESHSREATEGILQIMGGLGYTARVEEAPSHEHRPIGYNPQVFGTPPETPTAPD